MKISMIAAMGKDRVIGLNNEMPWHLPADLKWFKKTTLGSPVIMGRKTYDSIGSPLPGRLNIILSRNKHLKIKGCQVVNSLDDALKLAKAENSDSKEIFITGGAQLYNRFLKDADRLYLTLIDETFEGDTFFPDYTQYQWTQHDKIKNAADENNPYSYTFLTLDRVR